MNKKWVCKQCNSTDVEVRIWKSIKDYSEIAGVRIILTNLDLKAVEDDDTYCHSCMAGGFGIEIKEHDEDRNIFKEFDTKKL